MTIIHNDKHFRRFIWISEKKYRLFATLNEAANEKDLKIGEAWKV